jgi:hypothetical protein
MSGGNDGIPEISPLVIIEPPRVNDLDWLTIFRDQATSLQPLTLPDFDKLAL